MKVLRPYQATALRRALPMHRLPLFLQMRLGKCIVSIRWAMSFNPAKVLVVAPLTTLRSWQEELLEEGLSSVLLFGSPARRIKTASESEAQWHLVNYEALRSLHGTAFDALPYDVVILDESTCIKNLNATTSAAIEIFARVPFRAILSGEPTPEGIEDIFNQFQFLFGSFMGHTNFFRWRHEFFNRPDSYGWFPKPGALRLIKQAYLQKSIMLSRKEAGVFDRKVYERRYVPLDRKTRAGIEECLGAFEFTESDGSFTSTKYAMVAAVWALELCGGFTPGLRERINTAKEDELLRLLKGELSKEPVVVWFAYNREIDAAHLRLLGAGIHSVRISGQLPREKRFAAIKNFQDGGVDVVLVQVACARFGLNFSRSDTEIYMSNSVKFELRNQSEDRLVHLTKTKAILVVDIVAEDSPDEDLVDLLLMKKCEARALKQSFRTRLENRIGNAKEKSKWIRTNSLGLRKTIRSSPARSKLTDRIDPIEKLVPASVQTTSVTAAPE